MPEGGRRRTEAGGRKLEIQSRAFIFDFYLQLILREKLTVRFFERGTGNAERRGEVQCLRSKGQGGYELRNRFVFIKSVECERFVPRRFQWNKALALETEIPPRGWF